MSKDNNHLHRKREIHAKGSLYWLDWPADKKVKACYTYRCNGVSLPPYDNFNLALHVGDGEALVRQNREILSTHTDNTPVAWLNQVHGTVIVEANPDIINEADASFTVQSNIACCVMTADCLPVFFCDELGHRVAIAHAGWRGLLNGVLQTTLKVFSEDRDVMVFLGPAISQRVFEVGSEVREAFLALPDASRLGLAASFIPGLEKGKWMADLYSIATKILQFNGVTAIYGGDRCTYLEEKYFYSYRRDGKTGRMASLIWIKD